MNNNLLALLYAAILLAAAWLLELAGAGKGLSLVLMLGFIAIAVGHLRKRCVACSTPARSDR